VIEADVEVILPGASGSTALTVPDHSMVPLAPATGTLALPPSSPTGLLTEAPVPPAKPVPQEFTLVDKLGYKHEAMTPPTNVTVVGRGDNGQLGAYEINGFHIAYKQPGEIVSGTKIENALVMGQEGSYSIAKIRDGLLMEDVPRNIEPSPALPIDLLNRERAKPIPEPQKEYSLVLQIPGTLVQLSGMDFAVKREGHNSASFIGGDLQTGELAVINVDNAHEIPKGAECAGMKVTGVKVDDVKLEHTPVGVAYVTSEEKITVPTHMQVKSVEEVVQGGPDKPLALAQGQA
jgi:hypothetical protein